MSPIITHKYNEMRILCEKMTHQLPHQRPNCEQILEDKHLWAFR